MTTARLILGAALLLGPAAAAAGEPRLFRPPTLVRAIGFSAWYEGGRVIAAWKKYKRADFKAYKLVRSSTMHDPVYPENGELFSTNKPAVTRYVDDKVDTGIWYYRLCVITKENNRWVSPVVEIVVNKDAGPEPPPTAKDFE
ncbi:MAG: hypothetical protein A3J82_08605 [Elusimicrobia bacterium RIFOXYA2_FULL_69_6]|nr:MAG: hypothetical protein A3J82_08605 [Elusimicrobia bacterium RIFOXYA2_FULL_69_6]